jgi:hypothetical protein
MGLESDPCLDLQLLLVALLSVSSSVLPMEMSSATQYLELVLP